jgi:type I restriction enzyme S subunit
MTNFILTSLVKTGMTVQSLKYEEFEAQSFPLPPLAEQKRIVTKVDELMALCDRLEAQQQEREKKHAALARAALARFADAPTPANLNFLFHQSYAIPPADLRKSILTLAVQGKLVPQDPNDEPAEELLVKIVAEKKRLASLDELKADKKAWVNSSANPPYDIPDSWCWVRLQDVFEISRGGSPRPAGDPRFFGGPIPWITVGEVTKDAGKYLTQTETGLTVEGSKRSRFIDPGDLLLTNSGATLGVPKISRIRGCMNDGVAVLRLFHPFDLNDFGYLYLTQQTPAFRNVNQGMGQPNLNTPIIAGWFFPIPPLAEQRRIVAKVDQLMALVDELEQQLAASRATGEKLLVALVAELTGTPTSGKASVPSSTAGRRGHPRK